MPKLPITLTRRVKIGIAFIYVAGLGWLADIVIPFTSLPNKRLWFIIALCIAESSFLIGVALLGKPTYKALKSYLVARLRPGKDQSSSPNMPPD